MSPNLYPGIRDEDVLLGCGEDTPELNIQVEEHAECRLRYLFTSNLGHIISPVSLISLIYIILLLYSLIPVLVLSGSSAHLWSPSLSVTRTLKMILCQKGKIRLPNMLMSSQGITARASGLMPTAWSLCAIWIWPACFPLGPEIPVRKDFSTLASHSPSRLL